MIITFKKATKEQAKLRMAVHGPAGSGKTFSALSIASALVGDGKIAVIDTEHGSASKYSDTFSFDVLEVTEDYHPNKLIEILSAAEDQGYACIVVDSLTHFWNGPGGFLSLVDEEAKKGGKGDSFGAWKKVDPVYKKLVQAVLSSGVHVIVTARAKQAYELTKDDRGKNKVEKLGMSPELREGFQYEMDIEGMLDMDHNLTIGKTRCAALDGRLFTKPGKELASILSEWLTSGVPMKTPAELAAPLFAEVEAATTAADLDAIATKVKAIGPKLNGQRDKLLAVWTSKKKAIAAAAAKAAEPSAPEVEATP